jgi:putative hydrolase of the HAD superfamily
MSSGIQAVIWDVGGVLWRNEDESSRQRLAEKNKLTMPELYSLVFESDSAKLATIGKISEVEHWNMVGEKLRLSPFELIQFQRDFWAGDRIDADLINFIKELKPEYKTGLLSNAWSGARNALVHQLGNLELFDTIIYSAEVGLKKPDPAIYELILERMQVAPGSAIFVDDVTDNITAAQELGIHGIQFRSSIQVSTAVKAKLNQ